MQANSSVHEKDPTEWAATTASHKRPKHFLKDRCGKKCAHQRQGWVPKQGNLPAFEFENWGVGRATERQTHHSRVQAASKVRQDSLFQDGGDGGDDEQVNSTIPAGRYFTCPIPSFLALTSRSDTPPPPLLLMLRNRWTWTGYKVRVQACSWNV